MLKKEIIINGIKTSYFESDDFDPKGAKIFLHGWKSDSGIWGLVLRGLENYIAVDLPGFGGSEKPDSVWGTDDYSKWLDQFLMNKKIIQPILVGHSFGGAIIVNYLTKKRDVKRAILVASAGVRKKNIKHRFYNCIAKVVKIILYIPPFIFARKKIRKKLYKFIGAEDYVEAGNMRDIYKKIINEDLTDKLRSIETRVFLIWGDRDRSTPVAYGKIMEKEIRNSHLEIIKDADHFPFLTRSEDFTRVFDKFVNK